MKVKITDKNAIYVDDMRITNRSTKWGVHNVIDTFDVKSIKLIKAECLKRGYDTHVSNIDGEISK